MSKNSKKDVPMWAQTGHRKPVSRRDFLAHGLLPFAATLAVPNWLNLLIPSSASAAPFCPGPAGQMIPFVTLHLAGGAGIMSNYVPMDKGGQMLSSYDILGLGKAPVIEREFGNVPFAGNGVSKFLQGIRQTAPTALPKTAFVAMCANSGDDRDNNKFAVEGMLAKAGLAGTLTPSLGTRDTQSGINALPAVVAPPPPLAVGRFTDIASSVGYAGSLANLKAPQKVKLAKLISNLSQEQTRKLASIENGAQIKDVMDCAGIKNESLVAMGSDPVDLRKDSAAGAALSTLWNVNANTATNNQNLVFGSVAYNVIKSNSGSGGLTIGGYDYHNNTRTTGDQKDLEAGQNAGRVLETAALLNKPVFLLITTDGAVVSAKSDTADSVWTSDRGSASGMYLMYFNPNGRPATNGFQIGSFTNGQEADSKSPVGGNTESAAAAIFANWLAANGSMSLFSSIVPTSIFETRNLDSVIKFG